MIRELGVTTYESEEQRFFLIGAPAGLPETFEHTVTGTGVDEGFVYAFSWARVDPSLRNRLVQGCGAFINELIAAVDWL